MKFFHILGIIQMRSLANIEGLDIHMRQVEPSSYLNVLNDFKESEIHNIVIDIRPDKISVLLKGVRFCNFLSFSVTKEK